MSKGVLFLFFLSVVASVAAAPSALLLGSNSDEASVSSKRKMRVKLRKSWKRQQGNHSITTPPHSFNNASSAVLMTSNETSHPDVYDTNLTQSRGKNGIASQTSSVGFILMWIGISGAALASFFGTLLCFYSRQSSGWVVSTVPSSKTGDDSFDTEVSEGQGELDDNIHHTKGMQGKAQLVKTPPGAKGDFSITFTEKPPESKPCESPARGNDRDPGGTVTTNEMKEQAEECATIPSCHTLDYYRGVIKADYEVPEVIAAPIPPGS